jgi:hypothetical protein
MFLSISKYDNFSNSYNEKINPRVINDIAVRIEQF